MIPMLLNRYVLIVVTQPLDAIHSLTGVFMSWLVNFPLRVCTQKFVTLAPEIRNLAVSRNEIRGVTARPCLQVSTRLLFAMRLAWKAHGCAGNGIVDCRTT